jgi:hypothetical protein
MSVCTMLRPLVAACVLIPFAAPSWACERIESCDLRQFMTKAQFDDFRRKLAAGKRVHAQSVAGSNPREVVDSPILGGFQPSVLRPRPPGTIPPPPDTSFTFFLRKDFEDIGLLGKPTPTAKAGGAEFTYTRDNIAKDTTFAGTGTVAVAYNYLNGDIYDRFIGISIAPYFSFNREIHSRKLDDNVDTKTLGIAGEIGFQNSIFDGSDYVRGRTAAVSDDIVGSTNVSATVEWLPTYAWLAGTVPGTYLNFNFMPELKAQYDSTTAADKTLAFSGGREALRIGPEVNMLFKMSAPDGPFPDILRRFTGAVTYHWWTETYSSRTGSWLDTSLTYNLDEEGHIGLKASYKRGSSEETGAKFDLYKLSLSAKLCTEVFSKKSC